MLVHIFTIFCWSQNFLRKFIYNLISQIYIHTFNTTIFILIQSFSCLIRINFLNSFDSETLKPLQIWLNSVLKWFVVNFNKIFRKNMICDNIKSQKKIRSNRLSTKHNFRKTLGEWGSIWPPCCYRIMFYTASLVLDLW